MSLSGWDTVGAAKKDGDGVSSDGGTTSAQGHLLTSHPSTV